MPIGKVHQVKLNQKLYLWGRAMNIFKYISSNIVKWWQIHITPILQINNNKRGRGRFVGGDGTLETQYDEQAAVKAEKIEEEEAKKAKIQAEEETLAAYEKQSKINSDILNNKIPEGTSTDAMEVLNRINREKEEARKRAIEKQWKQREEEERIAAIMNSNKVDVGAFIEEGKHKAKEQEAEPDISIDKPEEANIDIKEEVADAGATDEQLRRAQEIIDRLNREAAEDEAKKQAEIDAAKQQAREAGL